MHFIRTMSESEALTIKQLLVEHYSKLLAEETTRIVGEKGYTEKDFDELLNGVS